jgi:hypothetical protein
MLSKETAPAFLFAAIPILYITGGNWAERFRSISVFGLSSAALPVALIPLGYNFFIQYGYTVARHSVVLEASKPASHPASYLNNSLLEILGPIYNGRLLGPALLLFAFIFIIIQISRMKNTDKKSNSENTIKIASLFLFALAPFVLIIPGLTISRHILSFVIPLLFISITGYAALGFDRSSTIRMTQLALGSNLAIALVGI